MTKFKDGIQDKDDFDKQLKAIKQSKDNKFTPPLPNVTERMIKFVNYYLEHENATQAVIQAGFNSKEPSKYAYSLLQRDAIKQLIEIRRREAFKASNININWIANKLVEIIDQCLRDGNKETAIKAVAELNKMYGNYAPEKQSLNVNINQSIQSVKGALIEYEDA